MGLKQQPLTILEGENPRLVAAPEHNDRTLLTLEDVTTWGITIHRVGADALPIYSLLLQSPTSSMFELDIATVTGISSGTGSADTATFTRASGSWVDDRYIAGLSVTASGFGSAAEGNGTWVIQSVTDLELTVVDTPGGTDVITTPDTGGTVSLTDASSRDKVRLINDALWDQGGENPGHSFQYVLNQADLSPNAMEGDRVYTVTFQFDCSDVAGKDYGDEFLIYRIDVVGNQAV